MQTDEVREPLEGRLADRDGEHRRLKLSMETMAYVGRHGGPIDNPEEMRGKAIIFLREPTDLADVSLLVHQKNDWESQELIWGYVPQIRRARRLSSSTRSDPVAGMDLYPDDSLLWRQGGVLWSI